MENIAFVRRCLNHSRVMNEKLKENLSYLVSQTDINALPKEWRPIDRSWEDIIEDFWLFGSLTLYKWPVTKTTVIIDPDNVRLQKIPGAYYSEIYAECARDNPDDPEETNITKKALHIALYKNQFELTGGSIFDAKTGSTSINLKEINPTEVFSEAVKKAIENREQAKNFSTHQNLVKLWESCQAWIEQNKPSSAESIYQVDSITVSLPGLAEMICDIVGYYKEPEKNT